MSVRRKSCALAVAAGVILVSGGCMRDVLAPPAKTESGATVRINGPMPVGTDREPVFILDGVVLEPVPVPPIDLAPADIHSIQGIQGPAAVRIYGTAGRNGVILIRTKRGAEQ
jgi:hypothetical protein